VSPEFGCVVQVVLCSFNQAKLSDFHVKGFCVDEQVVQMLSSLSLQLVKLRAFVHSFEVQEVHSIVEYADKSSGKQCAPAGILTILLCCVTG